MTTALKPLDDGARQVAEAAARVLAGAAEMGQADPPLTPQAIHLIARALIELRDQVRALHDLVDQTDPSDPIGTALAKVGLARRPADWATGPRLVRAPVDAAKVAELGPDQLLALYCRVMHEQESLFVQHESYVVRVWDGMDGCWSDCTGEVGRDEALRHWAEKTDGGTHHVAFSEIDYYRIFPGGTRMTWDGSEGRELFR